MDNGGTQNSENVPSEESKARAKMGLNHEWKANNLANEKLLQRNKQLSHHFLFAVEIP